MYHLGPKVTLVNCSSHQVLIETSTLVTLHVLPAYIYFHVSLLAAFQGRGAGGGLLASNEKGETFDQVMTRSLGIGSALSPYSDMQASIWILIGWCKKWSAVEQSLLDKVDFTVGGDCTCVELARSIPGRLWCLITCLIVKTPFKGCRKGRDSFYQLTAIPKIFL